MASFIYKGPAKALRVLGVTLEKGKQFNTEDPALITRLSVLKNRVEEVKAEAKPPKKDADKS